MSTQNQVRNGDQKFNIERRRSLYGPRIEKGLVWDDRTGRAIQFDSRAEAKAWIAENDTGHLAHNEYAVDYAIKRAESEAE